MAELPESGSPASVEDRIGALLDDVATQPEEAQSEDDEQEGQAESDAPAEDGAIEEELEGVTLRGSKEAVERLKSERENRADYTRKTQEVANLRRAAEDRIQFAEARERIVNEVMGDYSALQAKKSQLAQLSSLDLGQLYAADPAQAFNVTRKLDELRADVASTEQALGAKAQRAQAMIQQHRGNQWRMAQEAVLQKLGRVSDAENVAMAEQVQRMGFDEGELRGRFADHRFLELVFKAAKWDSLQHGKTAALQTANQAPPVVKPGAMGNNGQFQKRMQFAKAMKAAKTDSAKADLIGAKLLDRFGM